MTLQFQQKILPASVINEALSKKTAEIEAQEGRRPGRREREQLKEDIRAEKLPKAFTKTSRVSLFYDIRHKVLVVNASSEKKADTVTAYLREAIGSLPILPFAKSVSGADILTGWYRDAELRPDSVSVQTPVYLTMVQDPSVKSSHRNLDLHAKEIEQGLDSGMRVKKVGFEFDDALYGTIDEKFTLRNLKFSEKLIETASDSDDPRTDAMLMSDTLISLITRISKIVESTENGGDSHLQESLI
jgi:recombination associated protein RdgC